MSFWESDLGKVTGDAADAFAKTFTQIPDGTMALARIDSFLNVEYQGFRYLNIDWVLTDGDFKGQKVSQKLKVLDADPRDSDPAKTRHRGLNMLKLIYNLYDIKPKHTGEPTDQDLAVFSGKIAGIKVRETEPNAEGKQYNWVGEIHPAKGFKCETGVSVVVTHKNPTFAANDRDSAFDRQNNRAATAQEMTDDIPF